MGMKNWIEDKVLDFIGDKFNLSKGATLGLLIMTPIFLLLIIPTIIWLSLSEETKNSNLWLQDFAWIWILVVFGILFLTVVLYLIIKGVKEMKENKEFHKNK